MALASVLVVDDDGSARAAAADALGSAGYAVWEARGGREALRQIEVRPPDVLITALLMSDGDGIELICAVRSSLPTLPIIAMSDRRLLRALDLLRLATQLGANAALDKAVAADVLVATVARLRAASQTP